MTDLTAAWRCHLLLLLLAFVLLPSGYGNDEEIRAKAAACGTILTEGEYILEDDLHCDVSNVTGLELLDAELNCYNHKITFKAQDDDGFDGIVMSGHSKIVNCHLEADPDSPYEMLRAGIFVWGGATNIGATAEISGCTVTGTSPPDSDVRFWFGINTYPDTSTTLTKVRSSNNFVGIAASSTVHMKNVEVHGSDQSGIRLEGVHSGSKLKSVTACNNNLDFKGDWTNVDIGKGIKCDYAEDDSGNDVTTNVCKKSC